MVKNLLVIKGTKKVFVPELINSKFNDYHIIYTDSLFDCAIDKLDIEFDNKSLINKIVYIDSERFNYNGSYSFIDYPIREFDLVTPQYNYTPYRMTDTAEFNKIVIPDPSFFMCGSYTFNILSSIHPEVFNSKLLYPYYTDKKERVDNFNESHLVFFSILSSMDINIIRA